MTRVTAEKNRLQSEYKAGTVQLRAAQVTIFMNTRVSVMNCQCIYSSTCFIVTSNIYCFLVFLLHTEVSPAKLVFSSSLKNFTYRSLDHAYSVLNLFQILSAYRSTWNLVSCSSAELPLSGSFIYNWELRFATSDDSEFIWALEMIKHMKFMLLV